MLFCLCFRCGKTTQIPQFILDNSLQNDSASNVCNIVCTQPRRISAMSIADRVANERNEKVGGVVGFQIRLESATVSELCDVLTLLCKAHNIVTPRDTC